MDVVHHEDGGHAVDAERDVRHLDGDEAQEHGGELPDAVHVDVKRRTLVLGHQAVAQHLLEPLHDAAVLRILLILLFARQGHVKHHDALVHAEEADGKHERAEGFVDALEHEKQEEAHEAP